jgi:hypothetical protein
LALGITGLLVPAELQVPLRLSPLNARFVAALYFSSALGLLLSIFVRHRTDARIFVFSFGLATSLILVVTLLHWPDFMADGLPHRPLWISAYVVDPILALLIIPAAGLWPIVGGRQPLAPLFWATAGVLGLVGVVLLPAPAMAASLWPWTLPPVLSQVYGGFFLAFALAGGLAAREPSRVAVRNVAISCLTLALLSLLASLLHFDRFKAGPATLVWFGTLVVGAAAFAAALLWLAGPARRGGARATPSGEGAIGSVGGRAQRA